MSNRKRLKPSRGPHGRPLAVQESAGAPTLSPLGISPETIAQPPPRREHVREAASVVGGGIVGSGRLLVKVISAGWSLNNVFYGADVLREAARTKRWAAKTTHAYIDHATDVEEQDHPSGSLRNLAGALTTDAWWDEDQQALMAEVEVFPQWKEQIAAMAPYIGMSIRAWVTGEDGTAENRDGFIVHSIAQGRSVDFVTVPAAGGAIVSVLESLRATAEAPAEEIREALGKAVRASHVTDEDTYAYVRDFDPDQRVVWFEVGSNGAAKTWQQSYAISGAKASLTGEPIEVVARMRYEPANPPSSDAAEQAPPDGQTDDATGAETTAEAVTENVTDGAPPTAPNPPIKEEPAMSGTTTGIQPVEAGTAPVADTATPAVESAPQADTRTVAALEAVTAQLTAMQQQLAAVQASAAAQESETRALRNRARASEAVAVALRAPEHADVAAQIGPRVTARVLAGVPTTAEGVVDDTALTAAITAAIGDEAGYVRQARAEALEAAGVGQPYGLGAAGRQESPQDDGFEQEMTDFFGALGLSEAQAKIAAHGRN